MSQYRVVRHRYALDSAESAKAVQVFGNYVQVVKASSLLAYIGVEMQGDNLKTEGVLDLRNRDYIRVPDPFSKVYLTWPSQPGEWVEVMFITQDPAPEEFEYVTQERGVIDSIASVVSVSEEPSESFTVGQVNIGVAGGLIVAQNLNRKEVAITNRSISASLFIRATAGVAGGHMIPPYATLVLPSTADIYGYSTETIAVSYLEV